MAYFPYPHQGGYRWRHFLLLHCCLCKNTLVYIIKRKLHGSLKIWVYFLVVKNNILLAALVRKILFLPLENKIHIFAPPCNIPYVQKSATVEFIVGTTWNCSIKVGVIIILIFYWYVDSELTQIVTDVIADPTLPRTEDHECPK